MRTALLSFPVIRRALALTLLCGAAAFGQEVVSQIRVGTRPVGAKFLVDGVEYSTPQSFFWARGTKHVVSLQASQLTARQGQRFNFTAWESAGKVFSNLAETVVTADPSVPDLTAVVTQEYQVRLLFTSCPDVSNPCANSNGRVFANQVPYYSEIDLWTGVESNLSLQAEPMPGFVFSRWSGVLISQERSPLITVKVDRPMTIRAHFDGATPVQLVTIPEELEVFVDRAKTKTPQRVDWAQGVEKLLAAPSPQRDDKGGLWVFDGWEGLPKGQNVTYTPKVGANSLLTMTARFVPAAAVTVYTEPAGLRVRLNNQDIFDRNYSYYAAVNSKVTLEAPAEQFDFAGRKYVFVGWTNSGAGAEGDVPVLEFAVPQKGITTTARYRLVPRLVVDSSPTGRTIQVDGKTCRTPCRIDKDRNQAVPVSVPEVIPVTADSRYEFIGWADSGAAERNFVVDSDLQTVIARYEPAHRLRVSANPPQASNFRYEPASSDGFYRTGTSVTVTAMARAGFRFRRWEGDLQGTFAAPSLQLTGPRLATANFDVVPFADPTGVQNAAGQTPLPGVAPGSLGAIVGLNLASLSEASPTSPLAQSLGGVVIRMGLRLMPLSWVSPERIEFQVPSDLEPGRYKLAVNRPGQADAEVDMEVVSHNPALYTRDEARPDGGLAVAKAFRPNGSEVTVANPARRGEEISLLGTGFGLYELRLPDGFALPAGSPPYKLVDPVEVWLGDRAVSPVFAGAQGLVGINSIRFVVPDVPSGVVELRTTVGGRESNRVALPVE